MIALRLDARLLIGMSVILLAAGCENAGRAGPGSPAPGAAGALPKDAPLAVSSPYLEAAVREVLGRDVPLVRLVGPSMCPGHFDARPSQLSGLAQCRLLLRFDFQQALEEKFAGGRSDSLQTAVVAVDGGLCVPETYVSACRQVAERLVQAGLTGRPAADARLAKLDRRMASLGQEVKRRIEADRLRGAAVLASGHQAEFCRWLGLRVVAEISGADEGGVRDLDAALRAGQAAGVRIVVANEPEGRRAADALAERLHARVVVFANFPEPAKDLAFDALLRRNLAALLDAHTTGGREP